MNYWRHELLTTTLLKRNDGPLGWLVAHDALTAERARLEAQIAAGVTAAKDLERKPT